VQLAELLNNPWFQHFNAVWIQERDRARAAVCEFPLRDFATTVTALQTRGEAVAYANVAQKPYDTYNDLVAEAQEKERENERGSTGTGDTGTDADGLGT
jgi:hypothetical protein